MMDQKNKRKTALNLLNMIIEKAHFEDLKFKNQMIKEHKATKAVGESWMCFHLKKLKELL